MYHKVHVRLTKSQENKIAHALNNNLNSVMLRLNMSHLHNASSGGTALLLTQAQYAKLHDGMTHNITIPHSRLKQMHVGGFLPFLAAIPAILGALGGLAGIAGGVASAVNNSRQAQVAQSQLDKIRSGHGLRGRRRRTGGCAGMQGTNMPLLGRNGRGRPPIL